MNNSDLEAQIGALLVTLANTVAVDSETRNLLIELQRESLRLTVVPHPATNDGNVAAPTSMYDGILTRRLEELAVRFEAEHPAIGTAIRQTIDALVKAGI